MGKIFVKVIAEHDESGRVRPLQLTWTDGRRYDVDRVLDVRQAPSLKGGRRCLRMYAENLLAHCFRHKWRMLCHQRQRFRRKLRCLRRFPHKLGKYSFRGELVKEKAAAAENMSGDTFGDTGLPMEIVFRKELPAVKRCKPRFSRIRQHKKR